MVSGLVRLRIWLGRGFHTLLHLIAFWSKTIKFGTRRVAIPSHNPSFNLDWASSSRPVAVWATVLSFVVHVVGRGSGVSGP